MNNFKSGIVVLIGETNTGKSSIINALMKHKVSIISDKPDTTRSRIFAILNEKNYQIALVDSPGFNHRNDFLAQRLNKIATNSIIGNDLIYFVADKKYNKKYEYLINIIKKQEVPCFLIINKIDNLKKSEIDEIILSYKDIFDFKEYIPVSAKTKENLDKLIDLSLKNFTETKKLFPDNYALSLTKNEIITESVREKIFYFTKSEIPYASLIKIDHRGVINNIEKYYLSIQVEKSSQKKILLGNNGFLIKKIRLLSKRDLKQNYGFNLELDLFVKVKENWRKDKKEINSLDLGDL